ncbi:MAG: hypothetical protein IT431_05605 [Phycisphaerales bacterium]|nr:hypothetical protein [Phycisphaerales bacterium]
MRSRAQPAPALLAICLIPLLCACVSDKPAARPVQAPGDLRPEHMVIAAYPLLDDDNNGYPDTIPVVVYLWDDRYPLPMWADGAITFRLLDDQEQVIAEWEVPADVVLASRRRDQVGAAHQMTLDIRDATSDVRPQTNARLTGEFVGSDGQKAKCGRPLGIQIGS